MHTHYRRLGIIVQCKKKSIILLYNIPNYKQTIGSREIEGEFSRESFLEDHVVSLSGRTGIQDSDSLSRDYFTKVSCFYAFLSGIQGRYLQVKAEKGEFILNIFSANQHL